MKRLLLISTEFPPGPGGIGTHAWELARGLHARDWDIHVAVPMDYVEGQESADFRSTCPFYISDLRAFGYGVAATFKTLLYLDKLCLEFPPDVILATGSGAIIRAAILRLRHRIPIAIVGHGGEFLMGRRMQRGLLRWSCSKADLQIAVSHFTAALMREHGFASDLPLIIQNGADASRFHEEIESTALRKKLGLEGKRILLTVGNLTERKGQDLVIKALPRIRVMIPDILYLAVGLPTRKAELMTLATELGVSKQVLLPGRISQAELPVLYCMSEVFLLTSRQASNGDIEGFGIAALEAQMCGTPVIVTRVGGLPEAIEDGVSGHVVNAEDPAAIAEAVISILDNQDTHASMRRACLDFARCRSWAHRISEYDEALCTLLESAEVRS